MKRLTSFVVCVLTVALTLACISSPAEAGASKGVGRQLPEAKVVDR